MAFKDERPVANASTSSGSAFLESGARGRMQQLIAMPADWCWTLKSSDSLVQFVQMRDDACAPAPPRSRSILVDQLVEATTLGLLSMRAVVSARRPIEGLELTLRDLRGRLRIVSVWGQPVWTVDDSYDGYCGMAQDVTDRRRAEALLALEVDVARRLAVAATSGRILQAVMRVICEAEGWETAGYFRLEDAKGTMRLMAGWSGPRMPAEVADYYRESANRIVPAGGMLSKVAATGQPRWVRALKPSQTTWAQRLLNTDERATFFCPVPLEGRVLGVFAFASREMREPDQGLLGALRVICELTGQFLDRRRAEKALRQTQGCLRALCEVAADWFWEMDAHNVITRVEGKVAFESDAFPGERSIGQVLDLGISRAGEFGFAASAAARASFAEGKSFRELVIEVANSSGDRRWLSLSAERVPNKLGEGIAWRGLARDVTEQAQAQLQEMQAMHLEGTKFAKEEAARLKDAMVSSLSLGLRTSLNVIIGFSYLAARRSRPGSDPKMDSYLAGLEQGCDQVRVQLDRWQAASQKEAGRPSVAPAPPLRIWNDLDGVEE